MRLNFITPPPLPAKLPLNLKQQIDAVAECQNQSAAVQLAYGVLTQKYRGYRLKTFTRLPDLFTVDIDHLWQKTGFLHCTNLNYLLQVMLVESGHFALNDIVFKWTNVHFLSPHQYVRVKVGNEWLDVDVWGHAYGITLGGHAHGAHSGSIFTQETR